MAGSHPILLATAWYAGLFWAAVALAALWVGFILVLVALGRGEQVRAVARLIPDLVVLFRRLLGDRRVPRRSKAAVALTLAYLASPIDLVPDFIPVAGQLDDAIVVGLLLRWALRRCDPALVRELWPGPQAGLTLIERLAGLNPDRGT